MGALFGASFPPHTLSSLEAATALLEGTMPALMELLSVNGHAYYEVMRDRDNIIARLYLSPKPLAGKPAALEWSVIARRSVDLIASLGFDSAGVDNGYLVYEYRLLRAELNSLASIIASIRRIAGLHPFTEGGNSKAEGLYYPGNTRFLPEIIGVILAHALPLEPTPDPELARALFSGHMLVGPIIVSREAEEFGIPKSTLWRVLNNWLVGRGAAVRRDNHFYINLRHELILPLVMQVSSEIREDLPCLLLPYIEGVTHREWIRYPEPYALCREISEQMKTYEVEILADTSDGGQASTDNT
ncbi:MAG: hypothetical protein LRS46_01730 [Desulfurococcales archaeon]|nr:hypothetical protein [Desulfurococcales archaeon]